MVKFCYNKIMNEENKNKIIMGGEAFISLAEAATKFAFTYKYLSSMAQKGKLKVFKSGDVWYTCEKWILDHKKGIIDLLEKEIKDSEHGFDHLRKWVRKNFK